MKLKSNFKEKLKIFKQKKMKTRLIMILGIAGIVLIFLSEILPSETTKDKSSKITEQSLSEDESDAYKKRIEIGRAHV